MENVAVDPGATLCDVGTDEAVINWIVPEVPLPYALLALTA
jgi:hypothetical protein